MMSREHDDLLALAAEPHPDDHRLVGPRARGGSVEYQRAMLATLLRIEALLMRQAPEAAPVVSEPPPPEPAKAKATKTRKRTTRKG